METIGEEREEVLWNGIAVVDDNRGRAYEGICALRINK
jgi:hypothetical protein